MQCYPLYLGSVGLQWCGEPKRLETEASTGQQLSSLNLSSPFDLNFPLPGEKGPACLVKVISPDVDTEVLCVPEIKWKTLRICISFLLLV